MCERKRENQTKPEKERETENGSKRPTRAKGRKKRKSSLLD